MLLANHFVSKRVIVGGALSLFFCVVGVSQVAGQINLLHQEGFNDDGDGTRYTVEGRGIEVLDVGPGIWEHSFNVDVIGLPATAAARRAAILWTADAFEEDFTDESLAIWDGLVTWALDGKENARILFTGGFDPPTSDFLSIHFEDDLGHQPADFLPDLGGLPDPADVDLVIHTSDGAIDPPTAFVDYPVPVIEYNAERHDDTLISSIGAVTTAGPREVMIVEANQDHPVLGGAFSGTVPWLSDIADPALPLQGIGAAVPAGSTTLATYVDPDTGLELPAVLVIEEGDPVLGAFAPVPEGEGFFVGADLNEAFGGGGSAEAPRAVQLNPVDVSGEEGVKVSIALAASNVDFEPVDFLRVSYAPDEGADFEVLAEFFGLDDASSVNNKSLFNEQLGALSPDEFTDFTFEIPDGATDLILRVEAFNTFPNEVVGFDNIRVFTGEAVNPLDPNGDGVVDANDLALACAAGVLTELLEELNLLAGDLDGNGNVEFADFLVMSANFSQEVDGYTAGDIDCNGTVEFADFLLLSANFGVSAEGVAAAVPEPCGLAVLVTGGLLLSLARRRRR